MDLLIKVIAINVNSSWHWSRFQRHIRVEINDCYKIMNHLHSILTNSLDFTPSITIGIKINIKRLEKEMKEKEVWKDHGTYKDYIEKMFCFFKASDATVGKWKRKREVKIIKKRKKKEE